ncbi:MAG: SYNERG-CTERM sorting domain-containing protein [Fretibacterium sp.]|nr:SYNERG-CTERM sorting domain-containing protein [Fretibacterium sp.]
MRTKMRMKKCGFVALLVLALLCLAVPGAAAERWYVKQGETGSGKDSWDNARGDLAGVMDVANPGDEIWVAKGTYTPGSDKTDTFNLKKGVKVYGGFAGTETDLNERNWVANLTALSGDNNVYHVVTGGAGATSDDTRLDGFTVTGGNADYSDNRHNRALGGGMFNVTSSPTVANCTFSGNTARGSGGGMYNRNSSPNLQKCTFSDNTTTERYGGGMCNADNSKPNLEDCTFSKNTASDRGGGMYNDTSSPTLTSCDFSDNEAQQGGGMNNYDNSNPTVADCTFSENTAKFGGGMYNEKNSSPILKDCTFSKNTAASNGGGMYNTNNSKPKLEDCKFSENTAMAYDGGGMCNTENSKPDLQNCTFSGNKAEKRGGGMCNNNNSSPNLKGCTFSGNTARERGGGMYNHDYSSPTVVNCTFSGNETTTSGGGMYNKNSSPTVVNCTFSENEAQYGGGMLNVDSRPTVANTILWLNLAPTNQGPDIYHKNETLTLNHCVVGTYNTENNPTVNETNPITGDPKLTSLDADLKATTVSVDVYIYGLQDGSSALDVGLPVSTDINGVEVPNVDQRGTTRPQGVSVDIGAFEKKQVDPEPEPGPGPAPAPEDAMSRNPHDWLYNQGGTDEKGLTSVTFRTVLRIPEELDDNSIWAKGVGFPDGIKVVSVVPIGDVKDTGKYEYSVTFGGETNDLLNAAITEVRYKTKDGAEKKVDLSEGGSGIKLSEMRRTGSGGGGGGDGGGCDTGFGALALVALAGAVLLRKKD